MWNKNFMDQISSDTGAHIFSYMSMEREARINNHTEVNDLVHDC